MRRANIIKMCYVLVLFKYLVPHLILVTTLKDHYFTNEKNAKAQKNEVTCPRPQS